MVGKKFSFVSGSITHMHLFTTDGLVFHYPVLYGNIVDTQKVVPADDTILDIAAALNGEMWVGISAQNNLYLASSTQTSMLPTGVGIAPSPTRLILPGALKALHAVCDHVAIGLSSYDLVAFFGSTLR
jgi:hypothetical protein